MEKKHKKGNPNRQDRRKKKDINLHSKMKSCLRVRQLINWMRAKTKKFMLISVKDIGL